MAIGAPTHTVTRTVTMSGTAEYPTTVDMVSDHYGALLLAEDGTPTAVWLSTKRVWALSWENPRPEVAERMRTLYAARANFTFVDPYGASYSVMIPPGGLTYGIAYESVGTTAAGTSYKLSVGVREA